MRDRPKRWMTALVGVLAWWVGIAMAWGTTFFPMPRTVYHELAAPPIGERVYTAYGEYPRLSADGRWIAYRQVVTNRIEMHVVGFGGAADRVVDVIPGTEYRSYVLNHDGSVFANAGGFDVRTGSTSGSGGLPRLALDGPELVHLGLSDDGETVFFVLRRGAFSTTHSSTLGRGLYRMGADGRGLRLLFGGDQASGLLGVRAEDLYFDFAAESGGTGPLVCGVTQAHPAGGTNFVFRMNRDGSSPALVQRSPGSLTDLAISRDGRAVAWLRYGGPLEVAGPDAGPVHTVAVASDAPQGPLTVSEDGQLVMEGGGRLFRVDGTWMETVLFHGTGIAEPVLTSGEGVAQLAPSGTRGVFVGGRRPYGNQVCTFEFNPGDYGNEPRLERPQISSRVVLPSGANSITASAQVTYGGTPRGTGVLSLRRGRPDGTFYLSQKLHDDGTHGDSVAGDGLHQNGEIRYHYADPGDYGPRTLRFHAESTDTQGLRHAVTMDQGHLHVAAALPAPGSAPAAPPPVLGTNVGRILLFSGVGFPSGRSNAVVTVDGRPVAVLQATPTSLTADLPAWVGDGVHDVRIGNAGAVSLPIKFRSPGLPAPVLGTPELEGNPAVVSLRWSAQVRALYSVWGSGNLTDWVVLTNGVGAYESSVGVRLGMGAAGGGPRFFRVQEETGVAE